jgi:hypothetical protein
MYLPEPMGLKHRSRDPPHYLPLLLMGSAPLRSGDYVNGLCSQAEPTRRALLRLVLI